MRSTDLPRDSLTRKPAHGQAAGLLAAATPDQHAEQAHTFLHGMLEGKPLPESREITPRKRALSATGLAPLSADDLALP